MTPTIGTRSFIATNDRKLLLKATVNAFTPADATVMLQTTKPQALS